MEKINWESEGEASESGKKMGYSGFQKFVTEGMEYHIHAHGNGKWHLTRTKVSNVPAGVSTQQLDDRWDMSMAEIESQIAKWEGWI